ncbi:hypothetical protein HYQ45_004606 [Verticillium longisporum]|uniref:RNA-binding domain-containing protein n=1 Tax=Verticillium longisporum TaxID=100787 RepID=A0A8I2ZVQ1_VERLO|nr:hypothetical protein HYQ45_004606 [Verticillium longisporum]
MAAPRQFNNPGFTPNGAAPLLPNQGRVIQTGPIRVLCIADVRGNLNSLNELAKSARADHIIHTGDFGFYDDTSLERIAEKTLKHVAQYSPLIPEPIKKSIQQGGPGSVKSRFAPSDLPLSELSLLLSGEIKLDVPVYTVWGACEDVRVLEKFRSGEYKVNNLHIIDEARSMLLELGGVKLRLLGLGGAVVMHKLFDNGEGRTTIAGGQGTMWTTLLQMGELVDTAHRVYDPTETRVFVTHASPAREGILNQLSVTLKADFSISAGLHFRYGSSYNEFSQPGAAPSAPQSVSNAIPAPPATQSTAPPPTSRQPSQAASKPTVATPAAAPKPGTPQPAAPPSGPAKEQEKPAAPGAANGSTNGPEPVSSPAPKTPAQDIIGLFVMNVNSEEQTKELFDPEYRGKITKIEKWGNSNKVVQFASAEDRDAALNSLPEDLKTEDLKTRAQEDRSRPLVKIFIHRESKFAPRGGAGSWGSSRGGAGSANTGSGYRSAGGASDSESNRRGGRGGRGGGRGSERGRGRGRGGFKGEGGGSSPAPASATPAE